MSIEDDEILQGFIEESLEHLSDIENGDLDIELAKSVGVFFRLDNDAMAQIILEVSTSVAQWENTARDIGISRNEIELMRAAFRI